MRARRANTSWPKGGRHKEKLFLSIRDRAKPMTLPFKLKLLGVTRNEGLMPLGSNAWTSGLGLLPLVLKLCYVKTSKQLSRGA